MNKLRCDNFYVRKKLYTDFRCDGLDLCRYIRMFFPREWFTPNFIYVFFKIEEDEVNGGNRFRYDFVYAERWLNSSSVKRLGLDGINLYDVFTFLSNPTLWQKG